MVFSEATTFTIESISVVSYISFHTFYYVENIAVLNIGTCYHPMKLDKSPLEENGQNFVKAS